MADITMCNNGECEIKNTCYRWTAHQNPIRQSYFMDNPHVVKSKPCPQHWDNVDYQQLWCWFCRRNDDDLVLDTEFDTYVHRKCIKQALKDDPNHPEATLMKYLLE
jgi:hypothetical protein